MNFNQETSKKGYRIIHGEVLSYIIERLHLGVIFHSFFKPVVISLSKESFDASMYM